MIINKNGKQIYLFLNVCLDFTGLCEPVYQYVQTCIRNRDIISSSEIDFLYKY